MTETVKCFKCGMSFRVEHPPFRVEWSRCAEPSCGRLHWSYFPSKRWGPAVVGIDPASEDERGAA